MHRMNCIDGLVVRAVLLLSPDTPSEALNTLLSKKTAIITRKIFEVRRRI